MMLDPKRFTILAGESVVDTLRAENASLENLDPLRFDFNEELCALQRRQSNRGYVPAHLVKSMYGWTLRYASGLQGFSIITRLGKDFDTAVEGAREWASDAPDHRYVSVCNTALPSEHPNHKLVWGVMEILLWQKIKNQLKGEL